MSLSAESQSKAVTSNTYYRFSKYYDRVFGRVYQSRIQSAIRSLNIQPNEHVLELGVGTGISFDAYPTHANVTGVDLSQAMLEVAASRIAAQQWNHIQVRRMNATSLDYDDQQFDYVMAFHLVSVVDDVAKLMREMHRVCKPRGKLVIINHFRSQNPLIAPMMDSISPVTKHLGWRTNLRREEVYHAVPMTIEKTYKTAPWSLFTVVEARTNLEK